MRFLFSLFFLFFVFSVTAAQTPSPADTKTIATVRVEEGTGATLLVTVKNIAEAKGNLHLVLFTQEKGFPDDTNKAVALKVPLIDMGKRTTLDVSFTGVKPGTYALSCFHDANGNNKMDADFLGRPKERWAMSRNPRPKFRAPRWGEAKFAVESGKDAAQTLELKR